MDLIRHELGFWRTAVIPSNDELAHYYNTKYFSSERGIGYQDDYTPLERAHKAVGVQEIAEVFTRLGNGGRRFLDVGCGEGFVMEGLAAHGMEVTGLDLTADGLTRFHPHLVSRAIIGDSETTLARFAAEGRQFDLIAATNLLEHVRDPVDLMVRMHQVVAPGGLLRIQVPNDDGLLQNLAIREGLAKDRFFVAFPDHLSYFNFASLETLGRATGWEAAAKLGDFPIDLFIINAQSNYMADRSRGPAAHRARLLVDTTIAAEGGLVAFREGCGAAGLGRNCIVYYRAL